MFMARQSIVRILWICFCSTNFKSHINFSQFANQELAVTLTFTLISDQGSSELGDHPKLMIVPSF